jgi:hypothetical protein
VPAEDERFPGQPAFGTVANVTPIAQPAKPGVSLFAAHRWLWEAHQAGGENRLTRGRPDGRGAAGVAATIIMAKGKCDRTTADGLINEMERLKMVKVEMKHGRGRGSNSSRLLIIPEPPQAQPQEDDDEETDAPY